MKKTIQLFLLSVLNFIFYSCTKIHNSDTWVLGDGLWALCLVLIAAGIFSYLRANEQRKKPITYYDEKYVLRERYEFKPIYKTWGFAVACIAWGVAITIILVQYITK